MSLDALCAEEQRMVLEKYEESFSFKVFMPERAIQRHALTLVGEGYAVDHEAVTRNTERMLRHRIAMPAALMHAPESIEASDALHKFRWKTLTRVAKHGRQGYEVAWQLFARHLRDGCTTTRMFNTMLDACTSAEEQRVLWRHMLSHTGMQCQDKCVDSVCASVDISKQLFSDLNEHVAYVHPKFSRGFQNRTFCVSATFIFYLSTVVLQTIQPHKVFSCKDSHSCVHTPA